MLLELLFFSVRGLCDGRVSSTAPMLFGAYLPRRELSTAKFAAFDEVSKLSIVVCCGVMMQCIFGVVLFIGALGMPRDNNPCDK